MAKPIAAQSSRLAGALALALPVLVAAVVAGGCHREQPPVARVSAASKQIQFPHGRHLELTLRWEPLKAMPAGVTPVAFLHLLDAQHNVVRTFDHDLHGPWTVGQEIVDQAPLYHSAVGPALPAGTYALTAGLYQGSTRYTVELEGAKAGEREPVVAQVEVPEVAPGGPGFTFSKEWLPAEPGGDRQTVARRWLSGDGSLEVHGLTAPARVWMLLRLPKIQPPLRLMLEPGASQPMVQVKESCGGFAATVTGEGFHELAVPVTAAPCTITFDANFVALETNSGRKLSVGVEQLGWGDAGPPTATP